MTQKSTGRRGDGLSSSTTWDEEVSIYMSFVPPKTDCLENTAWNSEAVQEDLRNHILEASALWRQPHRHQSVWRYPYFNYDINGKRKVSTLQDLNWEHTSMESKPDFNKSGIPHNERHFGVRCTNKYTVFKTRGSIDQSKSSWSPNKCSDRDCQTQTPSPRLSSDPIYGRKRKLSWSTT